jgi:mannose/cellobiose epimerase-like protein (N-acyl-D-glucosamine 2-epimerase family)
VTGNGGRTWRTRGADGDGLGFGRGAAERCAQNGLAVRTPRVIAAPLKRLLEPEPETPARAALARRLWGSYSRARAAGIALSSDWRNGEPLPSRSLTHEPLSPELYRQHLATSLLPFWARHSVDREFGGFLTCLDRRGQVVDTAKVSAMQARMIYSFVRGYEVLDDDAYLDIARRGMQFLLDHVWDRDAGGWYHMTRKNGEPCSPRKRLFDQAYVLLGLCVYARATHDADVIERAEHTSELIDRHAWDDVHGGYYESCDPDWTVSSTDKTLCIQLEMLEAIRPLAALTQQREHLERAHELRHLMMSRMRDPEHGCFLENFHRDWRYHPLRARDVINLGHNIELTWLLPTSLDASKEPAAFAAGREVMDFCLDHAWDQQYGGLFRFVARNGSIARPEKIWWPTCEGILGLLTLFVATGDSRYREYAVALERFAFDRFADPVFGEWYTACHRDGSLLDDTKGAHDKAAYHTTHLCADVVELLSPRAGGT